MGMTKTRSRKSRIGAWLALLLPMAASAQLAPAQQQALVALYDSTNGPGWTDRSGWTAPGPDCSAVGIVCDVSGTNVTQISLFQNNLTGTLPASFAVFSQLASSISSATTSAGTCPRLPAWRRCRVWICRATT
jgi:hypothetical protein